MDKSNFLSFYRLNGKDYHKSRIEKGKLFNEYIEVPAILAILGTSSSQETLLDAGCGSGILSRQLHDNGFSVTGVDMSKEMIEIAKEYCRGFPIQLVCSDILDYKPLSKFDFVIGSFLMGYFDDLTRLLKKLNAFLNDEGRLLLSGIHPIRSGAESSQNDKYTIENYFVKKTYRTQLLDNTDRLEIYCHTLETISNAVKDSGFSIRQILEPKPSANRIQTYQGSRDVTFFQHNPSVIIFELQKLN